MRRRTPIRVLKALTLAAVLAIVVTRSHASTPDPNDRMNIWVGTWHEVVHTKETAISHAASHPAHTTCAWSADRGYMVCEYLSEKVDPKETQRSDHLSIFAYDLEGKAYKHLGISKDYKTLEETPISVEGNLWHYDYELATAGGKKINLRDSYEFVTPQKRITRIEFSLDGGRTWTLTSESVGTKIS
ncbi:MAG TPA: hypothetical protein VGG63_06930 [Steroidobacteraceae bacterium]|jgi:hypothetical protein